MFGIMSGHPYFPVVTLPNTAEGYALYESQW